MSETRDIVERLLANLDKYPGFNNLNSQAATTITTLRATVAGLEKALFAYKQEAECWRKGDGMGEFIYTMRDIENEGEPGWSDEALWSWEITGCKQLTDETNAALGGEAGKTAQ